MLITVRLQVSLADRLSPISTQALHSPRFQLPMPMLYMVQFLVPSVSRPPVSTQYLAIPKLRSLSSSVVSNTLSTRLTLLPQRQTTAETSYATPVSLSQIPVAQRISFLGTHSSGTSTSCIAMALSAVRAALRRHTSTHPHRAFPNSNQTAQASIFVIALHQQTPEQ